jgi:hypothetical protein
METAIAAWPAINKDIFSRDVANITVNISSLLTLMSINFLYRNHLLINGRMI